MIISIYCWFPFLLILIPLQSLKTNTLPSISLTFLLLTVPHVHVVNITLLDVSLFPFFAIFLLNS